MSIGPVEYMIVGFPGNQFNGEIAPALAELIESNTIRILDLVFVAKDAEGNHVAVEFDEYAAEALEPNSSAALLIWEDTLAKPLVEAMRASGGVLLEGSRIPHDLIEP